MATSLPLSPTALRLTGYDDVPMNVWDYGGDGPTLVLCHCTGTCARVWDPVIAQVSHAFRVLAVDSRGHGDSGKPEDLDAYVWKRSGDDLRALLAQLDLGGDVYAVGHSSGGAHITYAQLDQPGLFKKMMLIDAVIAPKIAPLGENALADAARRRRSTFDSKADALARFASKAPMDTWHPECLEAYVTHGLAAQDDGSVALKCLTAIEGAVYERGAASDAFERFEELDSSTLTLVTGSHSTVKPLVEFQRQFLADAAYHEIPQASHFIPQERPCEIAQLIVPQF